MHQTSVEVGTVPRDLPSSAGAVGVEVVTGVEGCPVGVGVEEEEAEDTFLEVRLIRSFTVNSLYIELGYNEITAISK